MTKIKAGKEIVEITNTDKVLFPKDKITKLDLIKYYYQIGNIMIPHVKNHAITMLRYPQGINQEGFYHKNAPDFFPDWIKTIPVKKEDGGIVHYVVANNIATLVYLANYGCITPHTWLSKIDKLDYPDQIIFDLDPPEKNYEKYFPLICHYAKELKKICESLNLVAFVKTTGSRGLHVEIPIKRKYNFKTIREFAQKIAQELVDKNPENLTLEIRKDKRGNRIFMDTLRNSYGATAVAPYAVRAKDKAPIATPLEWKELNDPKLTSQKYNISNIFKRIEKIGDPWEDINKYARLPKIK